MPRKYMSTQGHRRIRGTQALRLKEEIRKLQTGGMSIPDICSTLKLAKGMTVRHLYGDGQRRLINQIIEEATIDSIITLGEMLETVRMEASNNKILSSLGELKWTPEQTGTMARAIEKIADIIKLMSGRQVSLWKDQREEAKDPRLERAKERLKQLETQGLNGKTIDVTKAEEDEDDGDEGG